MTNPELKNCPFCGKPDVMIELSVNMLYLWVRCINCDGTGGKSGNRDKAIKLWNTRPTPSKQALDKPQAIYKAIKQAEVNSDIIIQNNDGSIWCILRLIAREHPESPQQEKSK